MLTEGLSFSVVFPLLSLLMTLLALIRVGSAHFSAAAKVKASQHQHQDCEEAGMAVVTANLDRHALSLSRHEQGTAKGFIHKLTSMSLSMAAAAGTAGSFFPTDSNSTAAAAQLGLGLGGMKDAIVSLEGFTPAQDFIRLNWPEKKVPLVHSQPTLVYTPHTNPPLYSPPPGLPPPKPASMAKLIMSRHIQRRVPRQLRRPPGLVMPPSRLQA